MPSPSYCVEQPHLLTAAFHAGAVVLNADFYKSTSKNILFEICEFSGTKPSQ